VSIFASLRLCAFAFCFFIHLIWQNNYSKAIPQVLAENHPPILLRRRKNTDSHQGAAWPSRWRNLPGRSVFFRVHPCPAVFFGLRQWMPVSELKKDVGKPALFAADLLYF
jgi:hypothetical protein